MASNETFVDGLVSETPAIIQNSRFNGSTSKYGFSPEFGGKKWRRSEHAHASYPGLFFSPARVQPLYGGGKKRRVQELDY